MSEYPELRDLMHRNIPHPSHEITLADIKSAAAARSSWRGEVPLNRLAPLFSAAAVLALVVALVGTFGFRHHHRTIVGSSLGPPSSSEAVASLTSSSPQPSTVSSGPTSNAKSTAPQFGGSCQPAQLIASIRRRGSVASAPFVVIVLHNQSTSSCTLSGYPKIKLYAGNQPQRASLQHGTYEIPDLGPHLVHLAPSGDASFALGTSTGDSGAPITITKLSIQLSNGVAASSILLAIPDGLGATSKPDGTIAVGITALVSGIGP